MKHYTLPEMLPYDTQELSYGTNYAKMRTHAQLLDRQVLFSQLFNNFYKIPELESFQLEVKLVNHILEKNENEFEPTVVDPDFKYSIAKIKTLNSTPVDQNMEKILLNSLSGFDNYLSGRQQEKVLLWIWKRGRESNLVAKRINGENLSYVFEINKELSVQLCQDAYQENYPVYYQQVMQTLVPNVPTKEVTQKLKI